MKSIISIFILLLIDVNSFGQDSLIVDIQVSENFNPVYFKSKDYAIQIPAKWIKSNRYIFQRKLHRKIWKLNLSQDTIWLNQYIKKKYLQEFNLKVMSKLRTGDLNIHLLNAKSQLSQLLYTKGLKGLLIEERIIDRSSGIIFFESRRHQPGCPKF